MMNEFLRRNRLPDEYLEIAKRWFDPLLEWLVKRTRCEPGQVPFVVGINGCQGSGKSTLADYLATFLAERADLSAATLSLDDFYLTKEERKTLAGKCHALLRTRGVPGTHDVSLLLRTLQALKNPGAECMVRVPEFDKTRDDRSGTRRVRLPVDLIVLEGWCLGATPESPSRLATPINALEASKDTAGTWRRFVNEQLRGTYRRINDLVDCWVMLRAPSFACVTRWREEQEAKLQSRGMSQRQVLEFIQYFQRVTQSCLRSLPGKVHYLLELDEDRQITQCINRLPAL